MKNKIASLVVLSLLFLSMDALALMHTEANGLIARDSYGTYWLTDMTTFANKTPKEIEEAIRQISIDGYSNFRIPFVYDKILPSADELVQYFVPSSHPMVPNYDWAEYLGMLVVPPNYIDYENQEYGYTILGKGCNTAYDNIITVRDFITQWENISSPYWGAWVICDKDTVPVPEPSTLIQIIALLVGTAIYYRKKIFRE